MTFGGTLSGFQFHILAGGRVFSLVCPTQIMNENNRRRHRYSFSFRFDDGKTGMDIVVFASNTLIAEQSASGDFPLAVVRAAKWAAVKGQTSYDINTDNYPTLVEDAFADAQPPEVRSAIVSYILERYQIQFEPAFTVTEIVVALESSAQRIVGALHYLHKHEMISFGWSSGIWKAMTDGMWLAEKFQMTEAHLSRLKAEVKVTTTLPPEQLAGSSSEYDFFICHASEDKAKVAKPLAEELTRRGAKVWYDEWALQIGDSLSSKIDEGLIRSKYGIVILSPNFFAKEWPKHELSGLVQKEIKRPKVILPVWHNVDRDYILERSPTLADRLAVSTERGIAHVADEIIKAAAIGTPKSGPASAESV